MYIYSYHSKLLEMQGHLPVIESSEWAFKEGNYTAYIDTYIFVFIRSIRLPEVSTDNIDVIEPSEWAFTEENYTACIHVDSYIFIYTRSIKLLEVFADTVVVDLLGDNYENDFALCEIFIYKNNMFKCLSL